jgi:phosphate starvation-inducible membrane PsiE
MSSVCASNRGWLSGALGTARQSAVAEWRRHRVLWVTSAVLLLLSAIYVGRGLRQLVFQNELAVDLQMRWLEQRYVYNGQNPYDVVELVHAQKFNLPLPECTRDNRVDPEIGKLYHRAGGYPPWTFLTVAPIVLPTQWHFATTYFAILNVLALAITFVWAYLIGRPHSQAGGVFLGAAAVAVFGNFRSLQVGQYGILVNALLIGVYWLVQKRRPVAGGILFGLATLKPQISVLFGLSFLARRQWRALVAATAYVVLATLFTWVMTKTNPIEMLEQMYALAQRWAYHPNPFIHEQIGLGCNSFTSVLIDLQLAPRVATPLAAITGLLLTGVLMWLWQNSSTLTLFAIVATTGRLWSYHRPYDDVMLIFLIVALGKLVITHRSMGTVFAFCLVGLSLWAPFPKAFPPLPVQIAIISSWLFGLAVLLMWEPRADQIKDQINLNETIASV